MKPKIFSATLIFFTVKIFAQTNLFVAADGSAQFTSVQSAIMAVPMGTRENPVVIHIAPGTYKELIYIQREKRFFKLAGDSPTNTIITFDLYAGITNAEGRPIGTFKTPSTTIDADDFTAENLTFENSAGPVGQDDMFHCAFVKPAHSNLGAVAQAGDILKLRVQPVGGTEQELFVADQEYRAGKK